MHQMSASSLSNAPSVPPFERPRERLFVNGPGALSDQELIAILLGTGVRGRSAISMASDLVSYAHGSESIGRLDPDELRVRLGLGTARTARILAAIELGRRATSGRAEQQPVIHSPRDAARLFRSTMADLPTEHVNVIVLDRQMRLIRTMNVHRGTRVGSPMCPQAIFRAAVVANANGIIVAHNHPSEELRASEADLSATEMLVTAGETLGIELVDHLVITRAGHLSLRRRDPGYALPPRIRGGRSPRRSGDDAADDVSI
ncbi:MAG: DNA repair protein RadC [Myxococcales bacterium]|nr:DNA repair protein RadC [Myxococcales bacterium]